MEEYLKKKFRYQMTPYAIEIERLVAGLENVRGYGGSLEPTRLEAIAAGLARIEACGGELPEGEAESLWQSIHELFTRLVDDASDYLAALNGGRGGDPL